MRLITSFLFVGIFAGGFVSCSSDSESNSDQVDYSGGTLEIGHGGQRLVYIDQYANGARITIALPDGSEVIAALDERFQNLEEVFVVKEVLNEETGVKAKKFISIDKNGEVEEIEQGEKEGKSN